MTISWLGRLAKARRPGQRRQQAHHRRPRDSGRRARLRRRGKRRQRAGILRWQVRGQEAGRTVSVTAPTVPSVPVLAPVRTPNGPRNPDRTDI